MPKSNRPITPSKSGKVLVAKNLVDGSYARSASSGSFITVTKRKGSSGPQSARLERILSDAEAVVSDAVRSIGNDHKAIDAMTISIEATQARTKAILDTF